MSERWTPYPQREEAQGLGCTCRWYGSGAIVSFNDSCPIAARHLPRASSPLDASSMLDGMDHPNLQRVREAVANHREAEVDYRQAVIAAFLGRDGYTVTDIEKAAGISRTRVYQIVESAK